MFTVYTWPNHVIITQNAYSFLDLKIFLALADLNGMYNCEKLGSSEKRYNKCVRCEYSEKIYRLIQSYGITRLNQSYKYFILSPFFTLTVS